MLFSTSKVSLLFLVFVVVAAQFAQGVPEAWEVARIYQSQRHAQKQRMAQDEDTNGREKMMRQLRHKLRSKSEQFAEFIKRLAMQMNIGREMGHHSKQRLTDAQMPTADAGQWQQNGEQRGNAENDGTVPRNDQQQLLPQLGTESVQMCIFMRIGCGKINRSNYSQRLRDFANRMTVHEKVQNGLIIHRKPSEQ
ncbi:hypothetical protein niasHT_035429 [Heterodera trifolii]|uniref:Uncharacterized protein n=1 Tax=Heterodera trifolii TaxID=157864 RepID=A0ABD2I281_9BILA